MSGADELRLIKAGHHVFTLELKFTNALWLILYGSSAQEEQDVKSQMHVLVKRAA